ncbi:MAG TPA: hypothetical protein VLL27_13610 [Solirubrobacterales bacterium]|nr:hypothetical protein [Solirubrobacterales bacterium]
MTDPEQKPAFYERRGFQGAVAVVGLLTAIWALVGAPRPWQVATEISAATVTLTNTEIVLDASASTAARFGAGGTKLRASQEAVARYVAPFSIEGFALRRAGGNCEESGDLAVGMGANHSEDVRDVAFEQQPKGKLNLANAVRQAVDDFQTTAYKAPQTTNRIVIFTSGEDECERDAAAEIREALAYSEIDIVTIFALNPSATEMKHLTRLQRAIAPVVHATLRTPENKKQLDRVVKQVAVKAAKTAKAKESADKTAALRSKSGGSPLGDNNADNGDGGPSGGPSGPDSGGDTDSDGSSSSGQASDLERRRQADRKKHAGGGETDTGECPGTDAKATGATGGETTEAATSEPEAQAFEPETKASEANAGQAKQECAGDGAESTEPTQKKEASGTTTTTPDETSSSSSSTTTESASP